MYLIIDDQRDLGCELIAKTAEVGKKALQALYKDIECLCIDHDLGESATGYDIIYWAIGAGCLPKKIQIVSMNPVGKRAIARILSEAGYTSKDNTNFTK